MGTEVLNEFMRTDFLVIITIVTLFVAVKLFLAQQFPKMIGVLIAGSLLAGFAAGWNFRPVVEWILGLVGITV